MTTLKNHINMKPIAHRLDEARAKLEAAKSLAADQVRAVFAAKSNATAASRPEPYPGAAAGRPVGRRG